MIHHIINISYNLLKRKYMAYVKNLLGFLIYKVQVKFWELNMKTIDKCILFLITFFNRHSYSLNKIFIDMIMVDEPGIKKRFTLNYCFLSTIFNFRFTLSLRAKGFENILNKNTISTITGIYNSARWSEREVWDMFGVFFRGNNDLRRILTDYGFYGSPLRKDFPLIGFLELYFNLGFGLMWRPVTLIHSLRDYGYKKN
jgi:NADH:ubiquinone oxidoreductase subunit C